MFTTFQLNKLSLILATFIHDLTTISKNELFFEAEKKSIFSPKYGYPENNIFYSGPITPEKDDTWLLTLMMVSRLQNAKIHGYSSHIFSK